MKRIVVNFCLLIAFAMLATQCNNNDGKVEVSYFPPTYDSLGFSPERGTLNFKLAPGTTTSIGNSNYFIQNGAGYISFYDKVSKSLSIYKFPSTELVTVLPLKKWLTTINLDKSSVYMKNFDSILICSRNKVMLLDSSSLIRNTIEIPPSPIRVPKVDNETPPVFRNDTLFLSIIPSINEISKSAHRSWKLLFGLNLKTNEHKVYYHLPELYSKEIYGYAFLQYGYCMNDKGNFVFSFPADTNVYETDLSTYNKAYFAKSKFQKEPIPPVSEEAIENRKSFQEYSLRDSYGAIFFDPYHKRYLRMAKQKMDQNALRARERIRARSILMLDEKFKVIGEGTFPENCEFNSLFTTADGKMYARYYPPGDYQLHFIRINYTQNPGHSQIALKK